MHVLASLASIFFFLRSLCLVVIVFSGRSTRTVRERMNDLFLACEEHSLVLTPPLTRLPP